jgi:hypothetical protein
VKNELRPTRERVRLDFDRDTLNEASKKAQGRGRTLSQYIEGLIAADLDGRNKGGSDGRI